MKNMTKQESRLLETLNKRFQKDEKKCKYKRCVYSYYDSSENSYKDNLILLPFSTRHSHEVFLRNCLYQIFKNVSKEDKVSVAHVSLNLDIHFIGYFDIDKHVFEKKVKKVIVSSKEIEDIIKSSWE